MYLNYRKFHWISLVVTCEMKSLFLIRFLEHEKNEMKIKRECSTLELFDWIKSRHQTEKNVNIYLISGKFIFNWMIKHFWLTDWINKHQQPRIISITLFFFAASLVISRRAVIGIKKDHNLPMKLLRTSLTTFDDSRSQPFLQRF